MSDLLTASSAWVKFASCKRGCVCLCVGRHRVSSAFQLPSLFLIPKGARGLGAHLAQVWWAVPLFLGFCAELLKTAEVHLTPLCRDSKLTALKDLQSACVWQRWGREKKRLNYVSCRQTWLQWCVKPNCELAWGFWILLSRKARNNLHP